MILKRQLAAIIVLILCWAAIHSDAKDCPPSETILPCRCSEKGEEMQIWCSHSNLPQVLEGIKTIARLIKRPIDELILENNQLHALPGRFFASLGIVRLMLRHNNLERLSNGWLNELEGTLVEIFIVERYLRSVPVESLSGFNKLEAITIQSEELKRLPDLSGLMNLRYLSVLSSSIVELQPQIFRRLPNLEMIQINGGKNLNRLEAGVFDNLPSLKSIDLSRNGLNWIHLRSLYRLPSLTSLKLSSNHLSDVGMIGRAIKDLGNLEKLRLDRNVINILGEGSFVDLPMLKELHLNDNRITELQYGSFHRTPSLKLVLLHNNHIRKIHPESFLQSSGSGVESLYLQNNEISRVEELRSLLDALPTLKFLDMSNNFLVDIPFGALRGHGTIEQLHLDNNLLQIIERDALMAMPGLRELRLRNNSLSDALPMPFWNLPGLKGLDLSQNRFQKLDASLLAGLPSLRRLDLSENYLQTLDPSLFLHTPMMETLNVSFNEIEFIHPSTFRDLDRLFEIDASHNHLREMITGLPKIVERLSVRGNKIATIPISAGKNLNLPNLRMLDMSHNILEYIPNYTFKSLKELRVLSLARNRLRALEDSTFKGIDRLEMLHLQDNQISQVHDRSLRLMSDLRDFNLQGNQIEMLTDNLFLNTSNIEVLDLSRNALRELTPMIFKSMKSLKYLDLSGNNLIDVPDSLSLLTKLMDVDISFNKLAYLSPSIIGAWKNVLEVRLSNNQIETLKHGTVRNLPKLQYLDLSSNEISSIESGAVRNLPDLQELVLADNKLVDLKDHAFEELPNLQATHLQHNLLRYISPNSFYKSPSLVYLNLSANHFGTMDNIGLRSMRNLEVLDLSHNAVRMVNTMPLQALNWLVELKMDNNRICRVQGEPFTTMPRLRVLSMRNNKMKTMSEKTFRNLRGNIAVLDIDGNPISCSCEMLWLSVWLEESNSPNPGPLCENGKTLRNARLDKNDCGDLRSSSSYNQLPLMNEHGDVFVREIGFDLNDDCDAADDGIQKPLPGESEYFYDQYIDYPSNESHHAQIKNLSNPNGVNAIHAIRPSSIPVNNTILNYNLYNRPRPPIPQTSQFTFFGYPLPSLGVGKFFGANGRKSDARSQQPPTRGRTRMYRPNDTEIEKFLSHDMQYHDITSRNRATDLGSGENQFTDEQQTFRTPFRSPNVEKGGFTPMVPGSIGGFIPIDNPYNKNETSQRFQPTQSSTEPNRIYDEKKLNNLVPVSLDLPTRSGLKEKFLPTTVVTTSELEYNHFNERRFSTVPYDFEKSFTGNTDVAISNMEIDEPLVSETIERITAKPTITTTTKGSTTEYSFTSTDPSDMFEHFSITSTPETILLIPPTSELEENTKIKYKNVWDDIDRAESAIQTDKPDKEYDQQLPKSPLPLGRPLISKVFTPRSPNLPTAEEYFRTTVEANPDNDVQSNEFITTSYTETEEPVRKHGMEWYYENYKKGGTKNPDDMTNVFNMNTNQSSRASVFRNNISCVLILVLICFLI